MRAFIPNECICPFTSFVWCLKRVFKRNDRKKEINTEKKERMNEREVSKKERKKEKGNRQRKNESK